MDENALRNIKRINLKLKELVNDYSNRQKEVFKQYEIVRDGKKYTLDEVDFTKPMIFICNEDFLSYISYYGILKINNVRVPDTTQDGTYSMIRTSFMIADSTNVKMSWVPMDTFYDMERDGDVPVSWVGMNYQKKDLILWRLVSSVGIGDDNKMYEGSYSHIAQRYRSGKLDWIFYIGSQETFQQDYKSIYDLHFPTYVIKLKQQKKEKKVKEEPQTVKADKAYF